MGCCCCCLPGDSNNANNAYSEEITVADGDYLQEIGNRNRTLEMIRQMMNHNEVIDNQPPPSYSDYNKYSLAKDSLKTKHPDPSYQNYAGQPSLPTLEYSNPVTNMNPVNFRTSVWTESVPRPSGDPPPVPGSWFRSQWESIRRTVTERLSGRSTQSQITNASDISIANSTITDHGPTSETCQTTTENTANSQTETVVARESVPSLLALARLRASIPVTLTDSNETSTTNDRPKFHSVCEFGEPPHRPT